VGPEYPPLERIIVLQFCCTLLSASLLAEKSCLTEYGSIGGILHRDMDGKTIAR
jgi:hypothetical protein